MTLFLVNYLQELKRRGSPLLPDSQLEIVKWFNKNRGPLNQETSINKLFALKDEIPLADASLVEGLAEGMHDFFMNGNHTVSPLTNSQRVTPEKFQQSIAQNEKLGSIVTAMVTAACMEILNDKGKIKPEIIDRLKVADYNRGSNRPILRDKLIYAYVEGVLLKSIISQWLRNKTAQEELQAKINRVSFMSQLIKLLPSLVRDEGLAEILKKYADSNPKLVLKTKDGLPSKEFLERLNNFILDKQKTPAKNREALHAQLASAIQNGYQQVKESLTGNVEFFPAAYMERVVATLAPTLIEEAIENINEHGLPIANDFRPTDFTDFVMSRVNDKAVHVSRVLNDTPIVFPDPEVVPAVDGESLAQMKTPFKDLLQKNDEMHNFIKQWVATAFKSMLTSDGHFSQETLQDVAENIVRPDLDAEEEVAFKPGGIITENNIDRIRQQLIINKMETVLLGLLRQHPGEVNDEFIQNLKNALVSLHPSVLASILEMPVLSNQANVGNLNKAMLDAFRMLQFSPALAKPSANTQRVTDPNDVPLQQKLGNFANSLVSALKSFNVANVADKAQATTQPLAEQAPTPLNQAFSTLLASQKNSANQPNTMESFVNKLVWLTCAQIFDERGDVRKHVKQFNKKEVDINACTDNLRKVLVNMIAESDAAKEFFLQGTKSDNLDKLISQIPDALATYSDDVVDGLQKTLLVNKNINKEKFFNIMKMTLVLFDMNSLMSDVEKKVRENVLPFQKSSIEELQGALHNLLMDTKSLGEDNLNFQKFITNLTLFGFAEVLDESGNVKLPGSPADDENRAILIAAYLRKVMITISMGWMANEKHQREFEDKNMNLLKLEHTVAAIEAALNKGLDGNTLLSLHGFPLYGNKDPSRFMIPLEISPAKANSEMFEMIADMTIADRGEIGPENPIPFDLRNQDDDVKQSVEEFLRLMPGVDDFFPREPAVKTLENVVQEARRKQVTVRDAREAVDDFIEQYKPTLARLYQKVETAEDMLKGISLLVKDVGGSFPKSNAILKKIRDNYKDLAANMATINLHYKHMLNLADDIKKNTYTHSHDILNMLIGKINLSKQQLKTNIEKIDSNIQVIDAEAKAWITNTDRLKGIKELGEKVNPYLHKLAIEIHRKKKEVAFARAEYIKRKQIVLDSKPQDFVWDDFENEVKSVDTIIENMTSHMQIVREKFSNFCNAPIEVLQHFDAQKLQDEINYHKEEFEANKKGMIAIADKILSPAQDLMVKIDGTEELHGSIFSQLKFLLMDNPAFLERRRISLYGAGTPFVANDGQNKPRFYPKRAAAMMAAIQGLNPELESDLKNKAILDAFLSITPGFTLMRTQKQLDFYKIIELLQGTQKNFYSERALKNINAQLEAFIEANNLTAQYQATLFKPGASPSAAASYGALASLPQYAHGDLHLWDAGHRGVFNPANAKAGEQEQPEPLISSKDKAPEEEKTWQEDPNQTAKKDIFINSRKF
jgi:hypothetical protein